MFNFFISLYYALFNGAWIDFNEPSNLTPLRNYIYEFWGNISTLLLNAFGGNWESLTTFNIFNTTIYSAGIVPVFLGIAIIMSTITMIGLCFATWKVIKGILRIFFVGWGN